ncbi:MAG: ATP--guanido phosphotransferase [Lachnospiraceae bacterium]
MSKWYEENSLSQDIIVASRVRLSRNLKDYVFPGKMSLEEKQKLREELLGERQHITDWMGSSFSCYSLEKLSDLEKEAFKERMVLNQAVLDQSEGAGLILSSDESISVVCNGSDHLRLLVNRSGMKLHEAWMEASRLDDCFNELHEYAFDEKMGYKTAFPTNVGTGMRVYVVLHLPLLSVNRRFRDILNEVSRYGLTLKKAFGDGNESFGSMYLLYNQKTLGISEKDIVQITSKIALQLAGQERRLREYTQEQHQMLVEDEAYKVYGVLKYARMLNLKDALADLSQLRWAESVGAIQLEKNFNFYDLMLQVQDATLQLKLQQKLDETALSIERAAWVRERLPKLNHE